MKACSHLFMWQKRWVKNIAQIAATCWQQTEQPHILSEIRLLLFIQLTDWLDARTELIPAQIGPSPLISSIKASSTAVKDVPLQLYADQSLPLEDR